MKLKTQLVVALWVMGASVWVGCGAETSEPAKKYVPADKVDAGTTTGATGTTPTTTTGTTTPTTPTTGTTTPPATTPTGLSAAFASNGCGGCHGATGGGGSGIPNLKVKVTMETEAVFIAKVRSGGGIMSPYAASAISDTTLKADYAWLKANP